MVLVWQITDDSPNFHYTVVTLSHITLLIIIQIKKELKSCKICSIAIKDVYGFNVISNRHAEISWDPLDVMKTIHTTKTYLSYIL